MDKLEKTIEQITDQELADLFRKDIEGIWNDVIWRGEANPTGIEVDSTRLQLMYEMSRRFFNRVLAETNDWIVWGGGDICPLDRHQKVQVELRNGETYSGTVSWFQWRHICGDSDIVKYRLEKSNETS